MSTVFTKETRYYTIAVKDEEVGEEAPNITHHWIKYRLKNATADEEYVGYYDDREKIVTWSVLKNDNKEHKVADIDISSIEEYGVKFDEDNDIISLINATVKYQQGTGKKSGTIIKVENGMVTVKSNTEGEGNKEIISLDDIVEVEDENEDAGRDEDENNLIGKLNEDKYFKVMYEAYQAYKANKDDQKLKAYKDAVKAYMDTYHKELGDLADDSGKTWFMEGVPIPEPLTVYKEAIEPEDDMEEESLTDKITRLKSELKAAANNSKKQIKNKLKKAQKEQKQLEEEEELNPRNVGNLYISVDQVPGRPQQFITHIFEQRSTLLKKSIRDDVAILLDDKFKKATSPLWKSKAYDVLQVIMNDIGASADGQETFFDYLSRVVFEKDKKDRDDPNEIKSVYYEIRETVKDIQEITRAGRGEEQKEEANRTLEKLKKIEYNTELEVNDKTLKIISTALGDGAQAFDRLMEQIRYTQSSSDDSFTGDQWQLEYRKLSSPEEEEKAKSTISKEKQRVYNQKFVFNQFVGANQFVHLTLKDLPSSVEEGYKDYLDALLEEDKNEEKVPLDTDVDSETSRKGLNEIELEEERTDSLTEKEAKGSLPYWKYLVKTAQGRNKRLWAKLYLSIRSINEIANMEESQGNVIQLQAVSFRDEKNLNKDLRKYAQAKNTKEKKEFELLQAYFNSDTEVVREQGKKNEFDKAKADTFNEIVPYGKERQATKAFKRAKSSGGGDE